MADQKLSPLRRAMHLLAMLVLAVLLAYALSLHIVSEEADHDLEHGPEAQQQLDQALKQYYNKK